LSGDAPDRIVTANVGCQLHLAAKADVPVQHWIELVLEAIEQQSAHSAGTTQI
jgi:glycolate oxidase iron-sulfur subunit